MSTTWGVSLDLLEAQQGRKWRLGEVKSPAPGAGPGGASQTTLIPVTEPCSSRERVALGCSGTAVAQNPQRPCGATTPTQLSHSLTSTFHLQNHQTKCNTESRGPALSPHVGRPPGDHEGNPQAPCESEPATLVALHLQSGEYRATQPRGSGWGALPMNHGSQNIHWASLGTH